MKRHIVKIFTNNARGNVLIENIAYMGVGAILGLIISCFVGSKFTLILTVGFAIGGFFLPPLLDSELFRIITKRRKRG